MFFRKWIISLASLAICMAVTESQTVIQILGNSPKQVIDGFGCSVAYMGSSLEALPAASRSAILSLLFTSSGAGFTIARSRISSMLEPTPGHYDYDAEGEERGNRFVLGQLKSLGVPKFFASSWVPPNSSTTNHNISGGSIINTPTSFDSFAAYLSNYVSVYNRTYGINFYAISAQNEPDVEEQYEACVWQPTDFVNFLGTYLQPRFKKDGVNALIVAPETTYWQESMIAPTLQNATSRAAVQIVASHPYSAGIFVNGSLERSGYDYFPLTKYYGKPLWQTEFNNASGDASIVDSIRIATLVHKHMTVPEATAWLWWWGPSNSPKGAAYDNLIYFDASGSYTVQKRLWAIAQFSRFVRPGWVRLDATSEPLKGVHFSAYRDSSSSQFALVVINENTAAADMRFNLYNIKASTFNVYRTSSTENLKPIGQNMVFEGTFTASLAPQSITTFVGNTNTSAAANPTKPAFITEFTSLAGSSGASGDLISKFWIGTTDPSHSIGTDETSLFRKTNTVEYVQYGIVQSTFKSFLLSVQRNADKDGLSFAAVSSTGALTALTATKSAETQQPGYWFLYTYNITSVPTGTQHIRIQFSKTNFEWNPKLLRLVIT